MATYNAYIGGTEITGFPLEGKDTVEIYCGNTLFWKKGKDLYYSVYARYKDEGIGAWQTAEDGTRIRLYEEGYRIPSTEYNKNTVLNVTLWGVMARRYTYTDGVGGTVYAAECSIAFKGDVNLNGDNGLYCEHYYKYIDKKGNTYKVDVSGLVPMAQDGDGVYSMDGTYSAYPLSFSQGWNVWDISGIYSKPPSQFFGAIEDLKAYMTA